MITKYRTPGKRAWSNVHVVEVQFERETEKCLFDKKGYKTLKVSDCAIFHDTREKAQDHLDALNAARIRMEYGERIRKAAPALLEALEAALVDIERLCERVDSEVGSLRDFYQIVEDGHAPDSYSKIIAAIAAAKGE